MEQKRTPGGCLAALKRAVARIRTRRQNAAIQTAGRRERGAARSAFMSMPLSCTFSFTGVEQLNR